MAKLSKKIDGNKSLMVLEIDPTECPFREFRDHELGIEFWGLGPQATRAALASKGAAKPPVDYVWNDEQTQPLPRSVRHYLNGWIRAEELAMSRWEAEVVIFEDTHSGRMSVMDMQLSHPQVLLRSSFCRKVLSLCYMLERVEGLAMEHTWESFMAVFGPEGWRPRYHIYSPGMKTGGGAQHRPGLSKSGCYLVRLYHLGAWRCVWVSDQVPVDSTESPLLPFSPLLSHAPRSAKQMPVTSGVVHLWPLLICKALLKLAAPDMNCDEDTDEMMYVEDEDMECFDIMHALTGNMSLIYRVEEDDLWRLLIQEANVFSWDEDDETVASTIKTKSAKKPMSRESVAKRSMISLYINDTKDEPPYSLPGITPAQAMYLIVSMVRDIPLKKPLPEPEVPLWKEYRWVDWARRHGLYEAYEYPRTKYLKVNGLLKLSYAPHLLDVQSTESITCFFREEQEKQPKGKGAKGDKELNRSATQIQTQAQIKEELREWMPYNNEGMPLNQSPLASPPPPYTPRTRSHLSSYRYNRRIMFCDTSGPQETDSFHFICRPYLPLSSDKIKKYVINVNILYYPSMFQFTTAASAPPIRIMKGIPNKALDIPAPKAAPLYLQIDSGESSKVRISISSLHPRILLNCGFPLGEEIEPADVILEIFEWFKDVEIPIPKAYIKSRGYQSIEINLIPGRHFCRLWIHSRTNWNIAVLSESNLLLGNREAILCGANKECPWAAKFLSYLGASFGAWIRMNRSNTNVVVTDREFYDSYQPDLEWDQKVVGYHKSYRHWMFRKALQSLLEKKLQHHEFHPVCHVLRRYFQDPDFGFKDKPSPPESFTAIIEADPCDCTMPEVEEVEEVEAETTVEEQASQQLGVAQQELSLETMQQLLTVPKLPATSQLCELASDEMTCAMLRAERAKAIQMHRAATVIQAHWRGTWARRCLKRHVTVTSDVIKTLTDHAFGHLDALSNLMNEFFTMFPGAKYAYSVASGLCGVYGLAQHFGTAPVPYQHKWIPFFQGVFYCHEPVQVHFDLQSTLQYCTVAVYNNDTGMQMPQAYNAHITFNFLPNMFGYTVIGNGTIYSNRNSPSGDVHWQLTVMSSVDGVFHVCDCNDIDYCNLLPLQPAAKLHLDEMFLPNRRNILGGITIACTKIESLCFRVTVSCPGIELQAVLRTKNSLGEFEEISRCNGIGEICWPYIRLKPNAVSSMAIAKKRSTSRSSIKAESVHASTRSLKESPKKKNALANVKARSVTKLGGKESKPTPIEPKIYIIEVIAVNGWALPLEQWKRVDEVRNAVEPLQKAESAPKAGKAEKGKEKAGAGAAKSKNEIERTPMIVVPQPRPDDPHSVIECSSSLGGGAIPKRDDERDLLFLNTKKSWDVKDPVKKTKGQENEKEFHFVNAAASKKSDVKEILRQDRGAQIRSAFREEFLVPAAVTPPIKTESTGPSFLEEMFEGDSTENQVAILQRPSPVSETEMIEAEEEPLPATYYSMPEILRDKFVPLYFVPLCTRDKTDEEPILMTPAKAEADREERHAKVEMSLDTMKEMQEYNLVHVLAKQRKRAKLLESILVDCTWSPELAQVLGQRDEAILAEIADTAARKKKDIMEQKKK